MFPTRCTDPDIWSARAIARFHRTPNSDMVDRASERARWRQTPGYCIWLTWKSEVYFCNHYDATCGLEGSMKGWGTVLSSNHLHLLHCPPTLPNIFMAKKPRKTMPFPAFCDLLRTSFFLLAGICFPTSTAPRHLRRARA